MSTISKNFIYSIFMLCGMSATVFAQENVNSESTARIESVTMALGTKGDEKNPVNKTSRFKPTDTIHAVVKVADAPPNTTVGATWVVVDIGNPAQANSEILSTALKVEGTRNVDFTLTPTEPFPVGTYLVEISLNGNAETIQKYTVK